MTVQQMLLKRNRHLNLFWASLVALRVLEYGRQNRVCQKPQHWAGEVIALRGCPEGPICFYSQDNRRTDSERTPNTSQTESISFKHHDSIQLKIHSKPKAAGQVLLITLLYKALGNRQQIQDLQSPTQHKHRKDVVGYTNGLKC